jgi:hypothetical protein
MAESQARLLIRISESLKATLVDLARKEHRSLNKQIEYLLDFSVRQLMEAGSQGPIGPKVEVRKRRS